MTPALARIKRAVREAIGLCGGVDGAGPTAGRKRSVAGDWHNLNNPAFPPLDCALALDEVAIAGGAVPPIISAFASELGGVFIMLGGSHEGASAVANRLIELADDLGALARDGRMALADGVIEPHEAAQLRRDLLPLITCASSFDQELRKIEEGGRG